MTVLVTGTFDGLHKGHEDLFRQAKVLGDRLVVVVGRDATVEAVKGHRPRLGEEERRKAVETCPLVDEAILGGTGEDKLAVIEAVRPEVVLLGYDQQAFTDGLAEALAARGLHPRIVRGEAFEPETYKSSLLYGMGQSG